MPIMTPLETIAAGRKGLIASTDYSSQTKLAAAAMEAGLCVAPGADDDHCKVVAAAGDVPKAYGFSAYLPMKAPASTGQEYAAQDAVTIVTNGEIWVQCETAAAPGGPVYVRTANAGAGEIVGGVRNDVDAGDATLLPNAKFASTKSGVALGIVKIRISMPST